jgi:TRAP-type mannitol/chloroaromatic compound transport system substrate-binding protein
MIPPQIKIGIAIAVIAALALMGWRLHAAVEKNGKLSAELKHSEQQVRTLSAQMLQRQREAAQDIAARDAATAEARRQATQNAARAATLASMAVKPLVGSNTFQ